VTCLVAGLSTAAELPVVDSDLAEVNEPGPSVSEQCVESFSRRNLHRQHHSRRFFLIEVSQLSVDDQSLAKLSR
jgi:hypothetical protein